jgi:hypothetical protein
MNAKRQLHATGVTGNCPAGELRCARAMRIRAAAGGFSALPAR